MGYLIPISRATPMRHVTRFKACLTLSHAALQKSYKMAEKRAHVHSREMCFKHLNLFPARLWHAAGVSPAPWKPPSCPPTL